MFSYGKMSKLVVPPSQARLVTHVINDCHPLFFFDTVCSGRNDAAAATATVAAAAATAATATAAATAATATAAATAATATAAT